MAQRDEDFVAFVTEHRRALLRIAYARTGDWDSAEDVLQDVLDKLYRKWNGVRPAEAFSYARVMVLRKVVDRWRARRGEAVLSEDLDHVGQADALELLATRLDLVAAVKRLPDRQQQVVVARFLCDMSVDETAAALRLSTGTVKSHTQRAMASLRQFSRDVVASGEER